MESRSSGRFATLASPGRRGAVGLGAGLAIGAALGVASALTWDFESDRTGVFTAFAVVGASSGMLLGLVLPRLRTRARAALTGAGVTTAVLLGLGMAVAPLRTYLGAIVLLGTAWGAWAGLRLLRRAGGPISTPPRASRLPRFRRPRLGRRRGS